MEGLTAVSPSLCPDSDSDCKDCSSFGSGAKERGLYDCDTLCLVKTNFKWVSVIPLKPFKSESLRYFPTVLSSLPDFHQKLGGLVRQV